jgi:uncharacterized protein (DUF2164 family)
MNQMRRTDSIILTKERKAGMITEIKRYFSEEREEEIGELAAALLLDFILEKLAPEFYNQGVSDSYTYMGEATEDLLQILK